jgi:peptidoglycan/xylan/chitin deacetylase (PgdA/CDA1 family)
MASASSYVLTFHGIGSPPRALAKGESTVWMSRADFDAVLDRVRLAPERFELTFDDGNLSDWQHALPALEARGLSATFFVVTERLGVEGFLGRDHLRELLARGMRVGSHGRTHVPWTRLQPERRAAEIARSKDELEHALGTSVDQAACPLGQYDRRVVATAKRAGYRVLYTSDRGASRSSQFVRARTSLHSRGPVEELESEMIRRPLRQARRLLVRGLKRVR